jgi:ADP-ribose pyrophosphatase YjhB (NUDIX family)
MMTDTSSRLTALIHQIETHIDRGAGGLPEEIFLFLSRITPLINVDLLIQDDSGRTLLTWRSDQFFGPGWHVPGGIIRHKESAVDRVHAVARQELSAAVTVDAAPILVHENIRHAWRDRSHAVSLLYRCRLASELDPSRRYTPEAPLPDQWFWHDNCPENLIPEQQAYARFLG